jgi:hypothetical protein
MGQALPVADGASLPVAGRKSAAALLAVKAASGKKGARRAIAAQAEAGAASRKQFGNSAAVFAQIQQHADAAKAGGGAAVAGRAKKAAEKPALASAALKL